MGSAVIRIIAFTADGGMAAHVGGPVEISHQTFDVDIPELEKYLLEPRLNKWVYINRGCVRIEVLENKDLEP